MSNASENLSPTIALVPTWDAPGDGRPGLFKLADGVQIPGAWEPDARHYDPKAIPTPFARAETMRLVLSRLDTASEHPAVGRFRTLLLGVTSGLLTLDADDLQSERYDNLGRALILVDPSARYFNHLRYTTGERTRSFGLTYHTSLFSPHARRLPEEWDEISDALKPQTHRAMALLADWREVLKRAGRWDPEKPNCEWQRGVNHVLEAIAPSENFQLLREHARLVGPVWLSLPTGRSEQPVRQEPIYLPSYSEGHAARFVALCRFRPVLKPNGIEFQDGNQKSFGRILIPQSTGDRDPIAAGMGLLSILDTHRGPTASPDLWINARGADPGLVDLLKPVELTLTRMGRPVQSDQVLSCPVLYPDPVRILFDRGLWPGASGTGQRVNTAAMARALHASERTYPDAAAIDKEGGELVQLGAGERKLSLILLDHFAGKDVFDLRALGFVLWSVFIQEAELSPEMQGQLAMSDTLEKLLHHTDHKPLEPTQWVYERIAQAPEASFRQRLAAFQRFLQAYRGGTGLPRLLERAARSFVIWASGREDVVPLGRPPARFMSLRLPTGEELSLALDAVNQQGPGQGRVS